MLQPLSVRDVEQGIVHLEERLELDEVDPTAPSVQAVGGVCRSFDPGLDREPGRGVPDPLHRDRLR